MASDQLPETYNDVPQSRKVIDNLFRIICYTSATIGVLLLIIVLVGATVPGFPRLTPDFFTSTRSRPANLAGIQVALVGSLLIVSLTIVFSVPIGILTAIFLEEIAKKSRMKSILQANISNLAGVPSIIYGILGLAAFVRYGNLGSSVLAASLTMSLLVLPTVILVTQEALRMVPNSIREASLALGASPWQTLSKQTIPIAAPTIMTGVIFAASRAIGETAPLIVIGAATSLRQLPTGLGSQFTVLPIQIFNWSSQPQQGYHAAASAAIIALIVMLLFMNGAAIFIRNRARKV